MNMQIQRKTLQVRVSLEDYRHMLKRSPEELGDLLSDAFWPTLHRPQKEWHFQWPIGRR